MKSLRKPVRWYCGRKNDGEDWSGWMHDWIHRRWKSCAKECTWIMSLHFSHSSTNNSFNYKTTGQLGYQLLNEVISTLSSNTSYPTFVLKKRKEKNNNRTTFRGESTAFATSWHLWYNYDNNNAVKKFADFFMFKKHI